MKPYDWSGDEAATALDPAASPASAGIPGLLASRDAGEFLARSAAGKALLHEVADALSGHRAGAAFDLTGLGPDDLTLVEQVLGEGEVAILIDGGEELRIQESVMAGLWRVRGGVSDRIEIADVPTEVRRAALERTAAELPIGEAPEGAMNVMPVLAEIRDRMRIYRAGDENHIINFTLLPMNEVDMAFLQRSLGMGPVRMLSRGYGTCRITATARRHVWSVQYLNSMETVILDTLEIGDVPVAARAAKEDIEDSAMRLRDILEAYL